MLNIYMKHRKCNNVRLIGAIPLLKGVEEKSINSENGSATFLFLPQGISCEFTQNWTWGSPMRNLRLTASNNNNIIWLIPWSWAHLEKPQVAHLLKNFPTFYGTRMFISVHVHKSPPLAPTLSQINPVRITPTSLSKIYFITIIIHPLYI
jgi:hypothetical protein